MTGFGNTCPFQRAEKVRIDLKRDRDVQWDYKNIVRRKGRLERLK